MVRRITLLSLPAMLLYGCTWLPSPLAPVLTACPFTAIGPVACGGDIFTNTDRPLAYIRSVAEWNAYQTTMWTACTTTPVPALAPPPINFSTNALLVFTYVAGTPDNSYQNPRFSSVCEYSDHIDVRADYDYVTTPNLQPWWCEYCANTAVSIPATATRVPIHLTICNNFIQPGNPGVLYCTSSVVP